MRVGFAIDANLEEMNRLLKAADLKELYSKKEDDAIIMYGLDKGLDIYTINDMLKNHGYNDVLIDEK